MKEKEVKMGKYNFGMKLDGTEVWLMLEALELLKEKWSTYKYQDMPQAVDGLIARVKKVEKRYENLPSIDKILVGAEQR